MSEPQNLGEFNSFEIYPMPMFATLAVADVNGVVSWYRTALGFGVVFSAPAVNGQPPLVHLRRKKYQDLLIVAAPGEVASPPASMTISFGADGEVDELAERAKAAAPFGVSALKGPIDTPWNTRDLRVTDPVGNRLVFTGRNPHPDPGLAERMKAMLSGGKP